MKRHGGETEYKLNTNSCLLADMGEVGISDAFLLIVCITGYLPSQLHISGACSAGVGAVFKTFVHRN